MDKFYVLVSRLLQKEASFCYAVVNFGILLPLIKFAYDGVCTDPLELALGTENSVLPLAYVMYGCTMLSRLFPYFIAIS